MDGEGLLRNDNKDTFIQQIVAPANIQYTSAGRLDKVIVTESEKQNNGIRSDAIVTY